MSVATALQSSIVRKVFLAEFSVRQWQYGVSSSYTYYCTTTLAPPSTTNLTDRRWLQRAKRLNGNVYLPTLHSLPRLNVRVAPRFDEVGQVGGGTLTLRNIEGAFDDLTDVDWDAGTVDLLLGVDTYVAGQWTEMDYGDYESLGSWRIKQWTIDRESAAFDLSDTRLALENLEIPNTFWTREDFPQVLEDQEGGPQPIAYGQIYKAEATCVDTSTATFRVAGHAIHSLGAVTVDGVEVVPSAEDLSNAEFTLSLSEWEPGDSVVVDFIGKTLPSGLPMVNPADVVEDLLETYGGETVDFSAERGYWVIGEDRYGWERSEYEMSLYLDTEDGVLDVAAEVAAVAGGLFFQRLDGSYALKHWRPQASEGVTTIRAGDIFALSREVDASNVVTAAVGQYAQRRLANAWQSVEVSSDAAKTRRQLPAHVKHTKGLPLDLLRCARLWASRTVGMDSLPLRLWTATVSHVAMLLEPGDPVRVESDRLGSAVYEVLEVERDFSEGTVTLVFGDWRGLADGTAFWTADAPTFPARLGGATVTGWDILWTDAQAQWARENLAFWCSDTGYAYSGDPRSYYG